MSSILSERDLKFSIIIPNYNFGTFLEKAIESVIHQNYCNREIIVIDGGSTDNSVEVIKKYRDSISYWVTENDRGTYDANNKGLKHVTGDFWCVLNSDDLLLPGALEIIAREVNKNPDKKWFAGAQNIIDETGNVTNEISPSIPEPIAGYTFLEGCWISHPTVFIHKSIINEVGEFERWHIMDYNYWLRMEDRGYFPYLISEKIAALRIHSDCKSYDQINLYKEALKIRIDFCNKKGILKAGDVKRKIKNEERHITRLQVHEEIANKNFSKSLKLLIQYAILNPESCTKRWFWGFVKQVIAGYRNDNLPINKMPTRNGTGSWDYK